MDITVLKFLANGGSTLIVAALFYLTTKTQAETFKESTKVQAETFRESLHKVCDTFDATSKGMLDAINNKK